MISGQKNTIHNYLFRYYWILCIATEQLEVNEMLDLSQGLIKDIIEAIVPSWEPALNGPQVSYMAAKCSSCSGTCKSSCSQSCKSGCKTGCKIGCKTTCKGSCHATCKTTCRSTCKSGCMTGCKTSCKTTCKGSCRVTLKGRKR